MGDDVAGARQRQSAGGPAGNSLPAFAGTAVLRLHLLHRVQGELRRVQGHGARPLRRAEVCVAHPRAPDGPEAGWDIPDEPRVLQLLHRTDDDERALRRPVRGSAPQAGSPADAAGDGSRGLDSGRDRGNGPSADPVDRRGNRCAQPLPRGRRRAELRRQRQGPARRSFQGPVDPACCRRRRRCARRRALRIPCLQGTAAREAEWLR